MNGDTLFFFDRHMDALPLYTLLEERILSLLPDTKVKVLKTQTTFANCCGFAYVSFLPVRRAIEHSKKSITVSFGLPQPVSSPRIDAVSEPYPRRWMHHVMVQDAAEIDEELMLWIQEAARFAERKERRR